MKHLLTCALLLAGCGSSSSSPSADLASSGMSAADLAAADLLAPADLAYTPPSDGGTFTCGTMTCGAGTRCCVVGSTPSCMSSCPDGGFFAECTGPADCGGNPCCITIGAGFTVQSVLCTTSATACPPMVDATTQSGHDRACHVDGDCTSGVTNPQLPDCCTNTATKQHVCFNKQALAIGGWTCP
jgi:hypothetical protein